MSFVGIANALVPLLSLAVFVNGESLTFCVDMMRNNLEIQGNGPVDCRDVEGFYWCVLPEFFSQNPSDEELMVPFRFLMQEFPYLNTDHCNVDFRRIADLQYGAVVYTEPPSTNGYSETRRYTGYSGGRSTDFPSRNNSTDYYHGGYSTSTYEVSTYYDVEESYYAAGATKNGHNIVLTLSLAAMIFFTPLILN